MKITIPLILGLILGSIATFWISPRHNWRPITIHTDGTWSYKEPLNKSQQTKYGEFVLQDARAYLVNGKSYPRDTPNIDFEKRIEITLDIPEDSRAIFQKNKTRFKLTYGDKSAISGGGGTDGPLEGYLIIPPKKKGLVRFTTTFENMSEIPNKANLEIIEETNTLAKYNNITIEREDLTNHWSER